MTFPLRIEYPDAPFPLLIFPPAKPAKRSHDEPWQPVTFIEVTDEPLRKM
jgi:hypothetical protein